MAVAFAPPPKPATWFPKRDPSGLIFYEALLVECKGDVAKARRAYRQQVNAECPYDVPATEKRRASIDFETRSACDLGDHGAHVYAEHPTTALLCMGWAIDGGEPGVWLPGQPFPAELAIAIANGCTVEAWNAEFEQAIWAAHATRHGFPTIRPEQWVDAMARAAAAAFPQQLGKCGEALRLSELKSDAGKALIRKLCVPRKPTKDDASTWNNDPTLLAELYEYCRQDIRAERAISAALPPLSAYEERVWHAHSAIVHRGITCDTDACRAALRIVGLAQSDYRRQVAAATDGLLDGDDIGSHAKLRDWLTARGFPLPSVDKEHVDAALATDIPADVRIVLTARRALGRSSTSKFQAMLDRVSADGRIRGSLRYHGATTGRWTGAGFQPQNLPKGGLSPDAVEACLADAATLDLDTFAWLWGDPMAAASSCLRACLTAGPGKTLVAADYAGIEARVLLWLAHDPGVRVLAAGGDLYRDMAAMIYGIRPEDVTKAQRQLGKIAILGLGYGMGAEKFVATCAAWGITIALDLAERVVEIYRGRFAAVKALWSDVERAAVEAVRAPGAPMECCFGAVRFLVRREGGHLRMQLPSGRVLTYPYASVGPRETPWGELRDAVSFLTEVPPSRAWLRESTYGGKLVENIVQAISRDIMASAILACEAGDFPIVLTVHDEIVAEIDESRGSAATVKAFEQLITTLPAWAAGCPIAAEGWHGKRYRK